MRFQCHRAGWRRRCAVPALHPDQSVLCMGVHMRTDQEMCRTQRAHTRRKEKAFNMHHPAQWRAELQQLAAIAGRV